MPATALALTKPATVQMFKPLCKGTKKTGIYGQIRHINWPPRSYAHQILGSFGANLCFMHCKKGKKG